MRNESKKLSAYIELLLSARDRNEDRKAIYCGETALKKLPRLIFTPLEEFRLYGLLGGLYFKTRKYSSSLDMYYKALMLAFKHRLEPAYRVYPSVMIGSNLMLLRNIGPAIRQFRKVEEYFSKYGMSTYPMVADEYYTGIIGLAYCYIYENEPAKAREIIEKKLSDFEHGVAHNRFFPVNFHHLKGEYLMSVQDYDGARRSFNECVKYGEKLNLPAAGLEARIHVAFMEMLENRMESAEKIIKAIIKEAKKINSAELAGEGLLLLSRAYTIMNMPEKAFVVEKRIKPVLNVLDAIWLYERRREYENLYNKMHSIRDRAAGVKIPDVLANTINNRRESSSSGIIGGTPVMCEICNLLEKIAPTDMPVLVQGETGTGKELVARALHLNSLRRDKNLVTINCGAMPETLLETELFGYAKGAFTGASADKKGHIEIVSGGTLFMDEIADMSPKLQQTLLRVLEEKEIRKIGGEKSVPVNARFVFASNRNVELLVEKKLFREDLFYRINTITINLPALRERRDDIPLLARNFLNKFSADNNAAAFSREATDAMMNYPWPGNIRELENEIKRICVLHKGAAKIEVSMLAETIRACHAANNLTVDGSKGLRELKADFEREIVLKTIRECGGNISRAARILKYNRSQFYVRLKALKIQ
ncbi:MAG: sigma-54-dependent Fis family transcriptional regulator [Planctomycetes bacterium]|nr:sigma-54-dependent Fis family transcriptional regulator [Planctomycetota bacterium]